MSTRVLSAIFAFSVTALCASRALAQGQPWLGDRRLGGGIGVRAGDFELHPGIAGEVGYDTNYFQSAGEVTPAGSLVLIPPEYRPVDVGGGTFAEEGVFNEPRVGVFRFRITPSLTLKTLGPQRTSGDAPAAPPKVNLEATVSASYNEMLATDPQYATDVADERYLGADATVAADILPDRPWGANIHGAYNRSVQPVNDPAAPPRYGRSTFGAGAALRWRPGGGVLEWSAGYDFAYVMFEDQDFSNFSSIGNSFSLKGRWLFLPRTALLYSGDYGVLTYPDGGPVKPQGSPLSSRLGINGLITNHLAALAAIGWKSLFFKDNENFDGVVGNAELTWYPLPRPDLSPEAATVGLASVSLGYRRDASASYIGNYYQSDGGYVRASYFAGGSVLLSLDASVDHLQRPSSYFSNGVRQSGPSSENRVNVTGFGEYRTSDSFGINTTLRYTGNITDQLIPAASDNDVPPMPYDDLSFSRFEAWLGVRWFL
jgi:hypothetical protein